MTLSGSMPSLRGLRGNFSESVSMSSLSVLCGSCKQKMLLMQGKTPEKVIAWCASDGCKARPVVVEITLPFPTNPVN